ncbi:MAG: bifunctional diguanylate cyclase/phosphodiesterase [Acidimicrobiales bacterium]
MNRSRRFWLTATALLVAVGALGSVVGASFVARNDAQRSHQGLVSSSMAIASRLTLAIQQENGLVVSAEAFVIANPNATNAEFLRWVSSMQVVKRSPEIGGIGYYAVVRPDQLSLFVARILTDPPEPLPAGQSYQITPSGTRPFYCLSDLGFLDAGLAPPLGYDACAAYDSSALIARAFTGNTYAPYQIGKKTYLVVEAPLYPGGVIPATAQSRTATILGLMGLTVRPGFVLRQSLEGYPDTAVALHYGSGSSKVTFRAGSAPAGSQSSSVNLHNGWHVETFGAVDGSGVLGNSNALVLLLGGFVLSLLLGALIYVLGTGRSRALGLVDERTGELHHLALHDSLTELPNRALIIDRIDQMLARSRREHIPVAVLFLDLDNFKDVNDTLGHAAGDQLLAAVAARLTSAIRQEDTVGRLGGDEFVVLAEGASLAAGAEMVAERILDVLATPFEIAGSDAPLAVTASIGIAEGRRSTPDELLRDADIALYQAKAAGKKCAVVFAPAMQDAVDDIRHLETDLHAALESDQFFLLYQPTFDLSSGSFTGVEALLRWRHPTRGVIMPDDFIPSLEASGLIVPVGRWVLEEACRQGAVWQRQGHHVTVLINVSAKQLDRDQIVADVHDALTKSGFDPVLCVLGLTERTLMHNVDDDDTVGRLTLLKALGVRVAIDDFGTGYSSLAYLRQFPVDMLKIDRSFVSGITETSEAVSLVHAMVQLGKALGLETVAEGVGNDDQRDRFAAGNVDTGQGFLFARPLDVEAVSRLLEDSARNPAALASLLR